MTTISKTLSDEAARIAAMTAHDRSILVEAGAGSGKTAIMAGRVAMLLASGVRPCNIAAVTFTELAASELLARVRDFVDELLAGRVPVELRLVLHAGADAGQLAHLRAAASEIDEITTSTIHGFCQKLIKPYPAEANIDPGAAIADRNEADLLFADLRDAWIRERLSDAGSVLLAEMIGVDVKQTVTAVNTISACMRRTRDAAPRTAKPLAAAVGAFQESVVAFRTFVDGASCHEPDTVQCVESFESMALETAPALTQDSPAVLVRLVNAAAHEDLCTAKGFKAFQKKGAWANAAKAAGLSKSEGERLFNLAKAQYEQVCEAWNSAIANAASRLLSDLMTELRPLMETYGERKRAAALLDFDDLIHAARHLLRNHEPVRQALAARYSCVLVDEFQDTDPIQSEIFWLLCGEAAPDTDDWRARALRPGALFLVGDPKQAIYRFRGADVRAYVEARESMAAQDPANVISIATNFRSCKSILDYVNDRFGLPLSTGNGQPGFTALDHWHADRGEHACVAALDVELPAGANADAQRSAEADAVAAFCARLIGSHQVYDHKLGAHRACRPGDIALLAPTGSDLWRFEEALERSGVPVATQAGKGFFWRQEIQDLIALTRVLADARDTLALGALLRGPLVGLTEEELLDIAWAFPREEGATGPSRLNLWTDIDGVQHALARDVLSKLQALAKMAHATTPHDLMSQATAEMRVRATLLLRHRGQAERALANVDMFLNLSRPYETRGLRAFAEAMTAAWNDEERSGEGRPDAQEESVSLFTMHAAKGLEWPVVIPINTSTRMKEGFDAIVDRTSSLLYCKIFGVAPAGYDIAAIDEKAEIARERVRLWYVAATRARELLVLPRLSCDIARGCWIGVVDLKLKDLPAIDVSAYPETAPHAAASAPNTQTRPAFDDEAAAIAALSRALTWKSPSRHEDTDKAADGVGEPDITGTEGESETPAAYESAVIQGGRERGLVMHKLLEEVLTGETDESEAALAERARILITELGLIPKENAKDGCSPAELAKLVRRALAIQEVAEVRARLVPECHVYGFRAGAAEDIVTYGIADAIAYDGAQAQLIVDWKSDVEPSEAVVRTYCEQVADYLATTGLNDGLVVFATSGKVVRVRLS